MTVPEREKVLLCCLVSSCNFWNFVAQSNFWKIFLYELSLRTSVLIFNCLQYRNASEAIPCLKHFQNNVLGTVLLRMRFLWSAGDYLSNCYCAALRAMTVPERERAARLFVVTLPKLSLLTEWQYIKLLAIILLGRSSSRSCHCEPNDCMLNR